MRQGGYQDHCRGVHAAPNIQLRRLVLRDSFKKQRHLGEVESFLHGASKADGAIERRGEDDGGVVTDGLIHADGAVDGLSDRLGLGSRRAGIK